MAKCGARWQPKEQYAYRQFRKVLCEADRRWALDTLDKIVAVAAFGDGVLRELLSTPKMRELLPGGDSNSGESGELLDWRTAQADPKSQAGNFTGVPDDHRVEIRRFAGTPGESGPWSRRSSWIPRSSCLAVR